MTTHKNRFNTPQALQYRRFKLYAESNGFRVVDLYEEFSKREKAAGRTPIHRSVFYRICKGKRSRRVQTWISNKLRIPFAELWGHV